MLLSRLRRKGDPPAYGTADYFLEQAQFYRRHARIGLLLAACDLAGLMLAPYWWMRPVWGVLLVYSGVLVGTGMVRAQLNARQVYQVLKGLANEAQKWGLYDGEALAEMNRRRRASR